MVKFSSIFSTLVFSAVVASAYDPTRSDNLVVYWGLYISFSLRSCIHSSRSKLVRRNPPQRHGQLAKDDLELLPGAAFDSTGFSGGVPDLDVGNASLFPYGVFRELNLFRQICDDNGSTGNCASLAAGIQACQAAGKIVTLSLGGGGTTTARFASDTDATNFATRIWNSFLGGSGAHRPFGSAILDGVDLDIESGTNTGYAAFATQIRSLWSGASKPYYLSAAPQCPFPDAWVGSALDTVWFDSIYIQFYNNYWQWREIVSIFCAAIYVRVNMNSPIYQNWNYATQWLPHLFANPNVKLYIGAPASSTAADAGEYVSATTLGTIACASRALNPSRFGGVMLWDASQAYANARFDVQIKNLLTASSCGGSGGTCTQTYIVKSGDTCSGIEAATGVSDAQLRALNPSINSGCTNLEIGETLCLKEGGGTTCTQTYTVKSGDTCSKIEAANGISDAQLHALNPSINSGCTNLEIGETLCIKQGGGCTQTYTVKSGDTCSKIEGTTGVSDSQLHALNPSINSGCTSTFPFHLICHMICAECISPDLEIGQVLCLN
ncbi:Glycoside hydrolase family 18 protein [Mycena sanguinolenta]|uniref:chitinase n=1 Tax=Mycena sanguinolenta TaxID=230812 RepID=A0A8H6ZGC8_9AGAR|nr:Glycoside hydrolase family 18 protein [Mycena sanguinolenta]